MSDDISFDKLLQKCKSSAESSSSRPADPHTLQDEALKHADSMISSGTKKQYKPWPDRLKELGAIFVLLIGGIGGGLSVGHIFEYYSAPHIVVNLSSLIFWCSYMLLVGKIELKSDVKSNYDLGYSDGYTVGNDEGFSMGLSASRLGEYDRGYQAGLLDGRADGYDYGYQSAQQDSVNK